MIRIRWNVEVSHRWIHFYFYLVAGRVREFLGFGEEGRRKRALEKSSWEGFLLAVMPAVGPEKWEGKGEPGTLGRPSWGRKSDLTFYLHPLLITTPTSGCHSGKRQPQSEENWRCWGQQSRSSGGKMIWWKDLRDSGYEEKEWGKQPKQTWFSTQCASNAVCSINC